MTTPALPLPPTLKFGAHIFIRPHADATELGYTHHSIMLPDGLSGRVLGILRKHAMTFEARDFPEVITRASLGRLEVTPGKPFPSVTHAQRTRDVRIPCESRFTFGFGVEFIVYTYPRRNPSDQFQPTFLEIEQRLKPSLFFDVTDPGCPFEQGLWKVERRWPDFCRG